MVFNLKGLMESVRPTQIGIGTLETIQDRFKDDRELDQQRLSNTIDSAGLILEDASKEVALINKRQELFAQTAEMYGPGVADYLSQSKTFALYDGVNNVNALKDLDGKAREAQRVIAGGEFELSENPYQFDNRTKILDTLSKVESELQALNNIPDKTGKVAIRVKELEKIKGTLGAEISPTAGVKVSTFPTSMSDAQKQRETAAYLATAMNLGVDYTDEKAMAEIGFPKISLEDAGLSLDIANKIQLYQGLFPREFDDALLRSDNILKTIQEYDGRYNEFLKLLIPKPSTQEDASLPTVTTQEEFDALPSGTIFLNADGSKAKKP
jgi:hypothetical protein